ncbi:MAG: ribosome maturation factor RimP [Clostridiales bacterium]|nr:ribosome maturation factor RimP [Clostridiales bacterium]
MAKRSKTAQTAYDIALPVAKEMGFDLVDAEYKKEGQSMFLRLFIDKKGGLGIDDCEEFSKVIDPILDESMKRDEDYFEVSSPGLTRPLETMADYIRYEDQKLEVSLFSEGGHGKQFLATIKGASEESETITFEDEDGNRFDIGLKDIAKAVRHIEF